MPIDREQYIISYVEYHRGERFTAAEIGKALRGAVLDPIRYGEKDWDPDRVGVFLSEILDRLVSEGTIGSCKEDDKTLYFAA